MKKLLEKKEEEGFTLIELIVVVVIISILSAIAIPGFQAVSDKVKQKEASILLSSYLKAVQGFYIENGYLPKNSQDLSGFVSVFACSPKASNRSRCKDYSAISIHKVQATSWVTPSGLYSTGIYISGDQVQFTANPTIIFNGFGVAACFNSKNRSTKIIESTTRKKLTSPPNC